MLRVLKYLFWLALVGGAVAAGGLAFLIWSYGRDLPDHQQLADYEPATVTRVHAGDGRLLAEYAIEKRVFVPYSAIPKRVVNAFLSAEDKNFFEHFGINPASILRAAATNVVNLAEGRRPVGASTITQQVAKNFLLTNEISITRKLKEAILAIRIEEALSKEQIMELYLNEIYLGIGSYGVAAASLNYFNKSLDQLTIAEAAYLAALPKAPNNYHPTRRTEAAISRRNWVIGRMLEDGRIDQAEAAEAAREPLETFSRDATEVATADYFAEEVRRELAQLYGDDELYEGGLSVRTTVDPKLQSAADAALRKGLIAYDLRHGWRGGFARIDVVEGDGGDGGAWAEALDGVEIPPGGEGWGKAVVLALDDGKAVIGLPSGETAAIPMEQLAWAREPLKDQKVGAAPKRPSDVLEVGEVILVEPLAGQDGQYALRQIPEINGGLVALDPHTGRILAMSGGFSHQTSEFNRATQAWRQPGSAFKPFVYLAAMDSGFTPSSVVMDAPIVIDQGEGLGRWKPANYTDKFYGPTPIRIGIEKSRNLMTVRLAQSIGMRKISDYAGRFGVIDNMPPLLSLSLGAGETTLLRMTRAYAMLVNGGKEITPTLIDRVQDREGRTIFRHDQRPCEECQSVAWVEQSMPQLPDNRRQVVSPGSAYQVVSMLQGVVERGTGVRARELGKPLAGKTGTTNDWTDAWFMGFSPDLAVGVYVGFDEPRTLGKSEAGSKAALPIWIDFMRVALEDQPATPFRIPEGVNLMRVAHDTGLPARTGDSNVIWEAFKPGTEPSDRDRDRAARATPAPAVDQPAPENAGQSADAPPVFRAPAGGSGTGGLY
jgi:penicillin-binding protein 1A